MLLFSIPWAKFCHLRHMIGQRSLFQRFSPLSEKVKSESDQDSISSIVSRYLSYLFIPSTKAKSSNTIYNPSCSARIWSVSLLYKKKADLSSPRRSTKKEKKQKIAPPYAQLCSLLVFLRYLSVPNLKLFEMPRTNSPQNISADALTKASEFQATLKALSQKFPIFIQSRFHDLDI